MLNVVLGIVLPLASVMDAPADRDVLKALPASPAAPGLVEVFRDDVVIVKTPLAAKLHAPRFFPNVGIARLAEAHWECAAYFTETVRIGFPFAVEAKKQRVQVVYIDTHALHPMIER